MKFYWLLTWVTVIEAAFGPAIPLSGVPSNTGSDPSTLIMRLGRSDVDRRQKINKKLKTFYKNPSAELVQNDLLSTDTERLLENAHWKLRRSLLQKIRAKAYEYEIKVDGDFGKPMTQAERQTLEMQKGSKRRAERAAYYAELEEAKKTRLAEKAEREARRQAEAEKAAHRKAEREAARKIEEERIAAEKKAEEERIAAEKKAEEERIAAEKKAEEERIAAEKKAEDERLAAEAAANAEEERLAAEAAAKAEDERLAAEAAAKAEEERVAAEAAAKAEEERLAAETKAKAEKELKTETSSSEQASSDGQSSATVTTKMIKELRESTGAGMMDCKKALIESNGDMEEATAFLRKKGLAKADKKASRVAAEGKIAVKTEGGKAVLVEVNCETDFVGKDANFGEFCDQVASAAVSVEGDSVDALLNTKADGQETTVEESRQALVAKIGENIQVRRMTSRGGQGSTVGAYVHMNRIGVLVELEGGDEQLCIDVAMHIAAMNPPFAVPEDVPSDVLDKERQILSDQALESGKPPEIVEKMVEGRIRKYLQEICLVSQPYVKDGDKTVGKLLEEKGAKMIGFTRIVVGEGIEKKEDNFAEEVAKMTGKSSEAPAPAPSVVDESKPAAPTAEATNGVNNAEAGEKKVDVTTKMIKELRESTGAGMMDCKKALIESEGDMEEAAVFLRKKGLAKADKKASRVAAEGKIAFSTNGDKAVLVEVNCETDFVGKDDSFGRFCSQVAQTALNLDSDSVETLLGSQVADGSTVEEARQALVAKIGENIQVRRVASRGADGTSTVGAYVHMNRIGVLVELEGGDEELCTDIAMHVAAMNPPFAVPDDVPSEVLDKERQILKDQALDSGKPPEIVEKMVEGRIRKYLQEICLVSQPFVKDGDKTVGQLLEAKGATMKGFTRIVVGEGIEKKEDNFAEEVAKMAGTTNSAPEVVAA